MRNYKFIKKIISVFLCMIMFVGIIPPNIVFADAQQPADITKVMNIDGSDHPNEDYSLEISWTIPEQNSSPDSTAEKVQLRQRNASISQKFTEGKSVLIEGAPLTYEQYKYTATELNRGSLYAFEIYPSHTALISNGANSSWVESVIDGENDYFILMTDIAVEAYGSGNDLIVTFDHPTFDGESLFTGYNISYQSYTTQVPPANTFGNKISINLTTDAPDITYSVDNLNDQIQRITYTITQDEPLDLGSYAVKVEPYIASVEPRNDNITELNINGQKIPFIYNSHEYRTDNAFTMLNLYISEDGKDNILLTWDDLGPYLDSKVPGQYSIQLFKGLSPESEYIVTEIEKIHDTNLTTSTQPKPTERTYYKLVLTYTDVTPNVSIESYVAVYDPDQFYITPNTPALYPKTNSTGSNLSIDLYWDIFTRLPYTGWEELLVDQDTGLYHDEDVVYDIWVTDRLENLEIGTLDKIYDQVSGSDLKVSYIEDTQNGVYSVNIDKYVGYDEDGVLTTRTPILENTTYYIKLVATKIIEGGDDLSSKVVKTQIYIQSDGNISTPNSLSAPPLKVKEDEYGNDVISQTTVTIEWSNIWVEVYDDVTEDWYTRAALRDGELIFGDEINSTDIEIGGNDGFYDMINDTSYAEIRELFSDYYGVDDLKFRTIDISQDDIEYELLVVPVSELMDSSEGYSTYLKYLLDGTIEGDWDVIDPLVANNKLEYEITGLTPNTRYATLLRAFRTVNGERKENYPTYVLATTLPGDVDLDVTPVTPTLYEVSKTETSILVEWEQTSQDLKYELAIDLSNLTDPNGARRIITSEEIAENGVVYTKDDGRIFIQYNIEGLFPDTGYYIWVRSLTDTLVSGWSNPIYVTTLELGPPDAPRGLGLASLKSLASYNLTNETKLVSATEEYLIFEWLRDVEDTVQGLEGSSGDANTEPLYDPMVMVTHMAKFNELLANRTYYVRAKTILTASSDGDMGLVKEYSYTVELSLNESFKEVITITLPLVAATTAPDSIVLESGWSSTLVFKTSFSQDEYDGYIFDDLYPLPTEDFDKIFDHSTNTLTFRFRRNENGTIEDFYSGLLSGTTLNIANSSSFNSIASTIGLNQPYLGSSVSYSYNYVDQRFITKVIDNNVFDYGVDLTEYEDYTIENRVVQVPHSIISAFDERQISLTITMGDTRVSMNPGFLNTQEVRSFGTLSNDAIIRIEFKEDVGSTPTLNYNETLTTAPQKVLVTITDQGNIHNLTYLGSNMDIYMKLSSKEYADTQNIQAYYNNGDEHWNILNAYYNVGSGIFTASSNLLANYTTMGITTEAIGDDSEYIVELNRMLKITDLGVVNSNDPVTAIQFNNIIMAIANNQKSVEANKTLTTAEYNTLNRSSLLLGGTIYIPRQEVVDKLVKLYEIKTKQQLQQISTYYQDVEDADLQYQANMLKAVDLGFFGRNNTFPLEYTKWGDFAYMLNILLYDCLY